MSTYFSTIQHLAAIYQFFQASAQLGQDYVAQNRQSLLTAFVACEASEENASYFQPYLEGMVDILVSVCNKSDVDYQVSTDLGGLRQALQNVEVDSAIKSVVARLQLMLYGKESAFVDSAFQQRFVNAMTLTPTVFQTIESIVLSGTARETLHKHLTSLRAPADVLNQVSPLKTAFVNAIRADSPENETVADLQISLALTVVSESAAQIQVSTSYAGKPGNFDVTVEFNSLDQLSERVEGFVQSWVFRNKGAIVAKTESFAAQKRAKEEKIDSLLSGLSAEDLAIIKQRLLQS